MTWWDKGIEVAVGISDRFNGNDISRYLESYKGRRDAYERHFEDDAIERILALPPL